MNQLFTLKNKQLVSSVLALFLSFYACSDGDFEMESEAESKNFGQAARIIYSCKTSTVASNGTTWTYQTDEIMNLMRSIKLTVLQDDNAMDH